MHRPSITGLLLWCLLPAGMAAAGESIVGQVESVQLLDASQLGGGDHLVLVLEDGEAFRLPGKRSVALGSGVRVSVAYRSPGEAEAMPEACSVRVLAVPLERDGEVTMQEAERPFEVYRNESAGPDC
ncbi:hypothetical protein DZK26_11960 [Wenzhouxiangella sp. 15190]|nr:hypothetical protein DZK26_11960 [Wenzhouxiangella sp. 15190]